MPLTTLTLPALVVQAEQLQDSGQLQAAANLYRLWLEHGTETHQKVHHPLAWFNLGALLQRMGETAQAIAAYRRCLALDASVAQAHINLGLSLERLGEHEEALAAWGALLARRYQSQAPDVEMQTTALNHLGRLHENRRCYPQAEEALQASLLLNPDQPGVMQHWVHIRQKACAWPVYKPLEGIGQGALMRATSPLAMIALTDDPVHLLQNAQSFVHRTYTFQEERLCAGRQYQHQRCRIGYVSGDLREHAVGFLLPTLLKAHDRERYELYAYDFTTDDGTAFRQQVLGGFDHVRSIHALDDRQAAQAVLDDEIDVLIDLHGLSSGARPGIFALHPAPQQGTYLGFIGSTAMPWLDFVLADAQALPPQLAVHFTERPVHMRGSFLPLPRVSPDLPALQRAELGLPEQAFVMAALGNVYKITPEMFACWMRLLKRIDDAVLWLIDDNPATTANLRAEVARAGVDADRVVFCPRIPHPSFCAALRLADVYLDTFPYNCGSTSADVVNAGVPLVTMYGRSMVSRMGLSLVSSLQRPDLAVSQLADYEDKVVEVRLQRAQCLRTYGEQVIDCDINAALAQLPVPANPSTPQPEHPTPLALHALHMAYSAETRASRPEHFELLDNTLNPRPDWREFWPMRQYLLTHHLEGDAFYGFFSPRFGEKTGLQHADMRAFVDQHGAGHDVLGFSPFWDLNALFVNPFEQGELFHTGLLAATQAFCAHAGLDVDVSQLVMHGDNTILCNYFVARRAVWIAWLELAEKLHDAAETPGTELYDLLNAPTHYAGQGLTIKVFVQERLISLLLASRAFKARSWDMFTLSPSATPLNQYRDQAVQANALKALYAQTGHPVYLQGFKSLRAQVIAE